MVYSFSLAGFFIAHGVAICYNNANRMLKLKKVMIMNALISTRKKEKNDCGFEYWKECNRLSIDQMQELLEGLSIDENILTLVEFAKLIIKNELDDGELSEALILINMTPSLELEYLEAYVEECDYYDFAKMLIAAFYDGCSDTVFAYKLEAEIEKYIGSL